MRSSKSKIVLLLCVMLIAVIASSCAGAIVQVSQMRTEEQVIESADAESAEVNITMGAGSLNISGGVGPLLTAKFNYNVEKWKPVVEYNVVDKRGILNIKQPSSSGINAGKNVKYYWDLQFANDIPLEMNVDLGAGQSELDFKDVSLAGLNVNAGVGECNIDMARNWNRSLSANIECGVGSTTIKLPSSVGVMAKVEKGIGAVNAEGFKIENGAYVNDAYATSDVKLDITISAGVGEVNLVLVETPKELIEEPGTQKPETTRGSEEEGIPI